MTTLLYYFFVLVGLEQQHSVYNAFNILEYEGFLRDQQGVQTLEVVKKFYDIINEEPRKAIVEEKNLSEFCEKQTLKHHAVITLLYESYDDSNTKVETVHAVRVSNFLFLSVFSRE